MVDLSDKVVKDAGTRGNPDASEMPDYSSLRGRGWGKGWAKLLGTMRIVEAALRRAGSSNAIIGIRFSRRKNLSQRRLQH